jgi:hypothetical protein
LISNRTIRYRQHLLQVTEERNATNQQTHLLFVDLTKAMLKVREGLRELNINNLLTAWSRVLLGKLTGSAASQEIPRILGNPKVHHRTVY